MFALSITERCLSGRKEQFAKLSYWKRYRGFESRPLREKQQEPICKDGLCVFKEFGMSTRRVRSVEGSGLCLGIVGLNQSRPLREKQQKPICKDGLCVF